METERRRRSGGTKTSKKGGKHVNARTAEEEARRREVVAEKLREKLELERRALKVVERLLEDRVAEDFLADCARFITCANYKDAIEERFIAKLCGYPICSNKLGKIPTQQYKISTKTNKVYDITERKRFCSNFCYKASKEFELQISNTPLWLRQHERPPEIKLMKKGEGGSSGEEVILSERHLQEEDVENPLAADLSPSESSDVEQEQDFVSSVVSERRGPRVHWGDLPKRTDEDKKVGRADMKTQKQQRREGDKEEIEGQDTEREGEMIESKTEAGTEAENPKQSHTLNTDKPNGEQVSGEEHSPGVEEATSELKLCSLSESTTVTAPLAAATQAEHTNLLTSPPGTDSTPSTESKQALSSSTLSNTRQDSRSTVSPLQPDLNITQVGMSKRGAAGLRDLLKTHPAAARPDSMRLTLLKCLRRTLRDWSTEETLRFLYGADHPRGSPSAHVKEEKEDKYEELDEDDLEDEVTDEDEDEKGVAAAVQKSPSAAAPDYGKLRQESYQQELKVREFYNGSWILPQEVEEPHGNRVTVQDQSSTDPVLPLVDSQAQHVIQKRITVERLTSSLRNIVGPLCLTMSEVSSDLNSLVRTFRFTNTNIIHKPPEWTLIAVVLLHLLSEVSAVVREALETPAAVEYLSTLMQEVGLQEHDLLDLVRLFKTPAQ